MAYEYANFYTASLNTYYQNANTSGSGDDEVEAITRLRSNLEGLTARFASLALADPLEMLEALDARIQAFEMTIVDMNMAKDPSKPYDPESLKREFLEEVWSIYLYSTQATRLNSSNNWEVNDAYSFQGVFANKPDSDFMGHSYATAKADTGTDEGGKILAFYTKLIDDTFKAGEALSKQIDPISNQPAQVWPVTSIIPYEHNGVTYDRITSIYIGKDADGKSIYQDYLVPTGINLSQVSKTFYPNAQNPVTFELSFTEGVMLGGTGGTNTATLVAITINANTDTRAGLDFTIMAASNNVTVNNLRALSPMEYLYYWTEARIKILKGQLAFRQALVGEVQEDMKQANAALAQLEKVANIRNQDEKGNFTNDLSKETIGMHLFAARAAQTGSPMFDSNGNDYTHNWGEWQTNRANLKSYVDRKSTQSQDMMLDYQQLLNRYNSAIEIMSKLQEKLDNMLKGNLRNL